MADGLCKASGKSKRGPVTCDFAFVCFGLLEAKGGWRRRNMSPDERDDLSTLSKRTDVMWSVHVTKTAFFHP
jgi:hypothetical protein